MRWAWRVLEVYGCVLGLAGFALVLVAPQPPLSLIVLGAWLLGGVLWFPLAWCLPLPPPARRDDS